MEENYIYQLTLYGCINKTLKLFFMVKMFFRWLLQLFD